MYGKIHHGNFSKLISILGEIMTNHLQEQFCKTLQRQRVSILHGHRKTYLKREGSLYLAFDEQRSLSLLNNKRNIICVNARNSTTRLIFWTIGLARN